MISDQQEAQHFIEDRVGISSIFEGGLFLFSTTGKVITHNTHHEISSNNYSYRDYFKQTMATAQPVISEPFLASFAPYNPVIVFTAPILDNQGKVIAIFAGVIDLTKEMCIRDR